MFEHISNISIKELSESYSILYRDLLISLNLNDSWKVLISALRNIGVVIKDERIHKMELSNNPSQILLEELQYRSAEVNHLRHLLRECALLDTLALISEPEPLVIVKQPGDDDENIMPGSLFTRECIVKGLPPPSYQWFHENTLLPGQTTSVLRIQNFSEENCGEYHCIASHVVNGERLEIQSNRVVAEVLPLSPSIIVDLLPSLTIAAGSDIRLHVQVTARPAPNYLWLRENNVLENERTDSLQLENIQASDQGKYRCLIRNKAGEISSRECMVCVNVPETVSHSNIASSKIALLIGNSIYANMYDLYTPTNDVKLIANCLRRLDFHVIPLLNLTLVEMSNAISWLCKILPNDAYVVFYFVGHGFQMNTKYMMPIDCPTEAMDIGDCYCYEKLIKEVMTTKRAQLLVIILDMCLKIPFNFRDNLHNQVEPVYVYENILNCSIVRCFSTSSHMEAYERVSEPYGVFAKHLSKFITMDLPITRIFELVIQEFRREGLNQKPELNSDDPRQLKLVDPASGDEELDGEIRKLYNLPRTLELNFPEVGIRTCVKASFFEECFLNSVILTFPIELNLFFFAAETNEQLTNCSKWQKNDTTGERELVLHDIQKAKSDIHTTVHLIRKTSKKEREIVDNCIIDLGCPSVVKLGLWFNKQLSS